MNLLKMLTKDESKHYLRKFCWVGKNLFWAQIFPTASGVASRVAGEAIRSRLPRVNSPFVSNRLLRLQSIDGALMAGLRPTNAWAKYALPKGLPTDGNRVLAVENPPHFVDDFDGEIPAGYGAGTKTLLLSDLVVVKVAGRTSVQKINYHVHKTVKSGGREHYDLVVTGIEPGTKQWELNIPRGPFKGRYAFITAGQGMLVTPMKDQGIVIPKPAYTLRKEEALAAIDPAKTIVERKIDGSLGNAHVQGQRVAFRSHRDGGETYYDRLPTVEFLRNESSFAISRYLYPGPQLTGTIFQGELSHPDGAARVSGILNSLPQNARAIQLARGAVRYHVWDIIRHRGRDVSNLPYEKRRALCEDLVREIRAVNKYWDIVEKHDPSKESPVEFYNRVTSDPLPWGEGIVLKPRDLVDQKWDKVKMVGFGYFKLDAVLPGEGKYANSVGRLVVQNPENGAKGEVGSLAVPDEYRDWIWRHRDDLIGETIKVRSQEVTARGVPRAGVFYGFHDGEVDLLMQAESMAGGDPAGTKRIMYSMKSAAGWRKS